MKLITPALIIISSAVLAGCNLLPWANKQITGTPQQQAEKLAQILERGGTASCVITDLADNSQTQITVKGKKMRFVGSYMGEGASSIMINDGEYTYNWTDGEKNGFKAKMVTPTGTAEGSDAPESEANAEAEKYEDEEKYKMECSGGDVADSAFVPPSDVTFVDYSQTLQQGSQGMPVLPSIPAGAY